VIIFSAQPRRRVGGFTLIEVLIAVFVVALGIGSLLSTISASARATGQMRDQSMARWVALNRLAELRLSRERPAVGTNSGQAELGNMQWTWRQVITDPGLAGVLRVDVAVARSDATAGNTATAAGTDAEAEFNAVASVIGFVSTTVASTSGFEPNWSFNTAQPIDRETGQPIPPGQPAASQ
jgi:general secretion pathway protein I